MGDALAHVWAKSAARDAHEGERLAAHTGAVLARLADWRARCPQLDRLCGRDDLWDLAAWACLLHDVGKTARGFQAMLRGGPRFEHRHEVLSLVAVGWLDVPDDARALLAAGVATHHKDLPKLFELYPADPADERARLLDELSIEDEAHLRAWLAGQGAPNLTALGFRRLAPLRELAKGAALSAAFVALARLERQLSTLSATDQPALAARFARGLVVLADHAGSAHAVRRDLPLLDAVSVTRARLEGALSVAGAQQRPLLWPHQEACAVALGHVLLRAPTGSGKTEAALLWAARQREEAAGRPAVFYVLPYRASLNAMRFRMQDRYGVDERALVLQHSSAVTALYTRLLEDKGYTRDAARRVAVAEGQLGRLMTAPLRVLTPYQLLRAFFGLRGHEAMLTDASGGLFVFDELHAYELERLALILLAVEHLARDLGARTLAMSATLPAVLRRAWRDVLGSEPTCVAATPETEARFERHRLRVVESDLLAESAALALLARWRAGQSVLAVATTVARAQRLYDRLAREAGEAVELLHGRFTAEDRGRKEQALASRMGTGARRRDAPGCILVATQVVEVSLDLDFDALWSDPAPVEALLQRFGRVNRACRLPPCDVFVHAHAPDEGGRVYDAATVSRAVELLRAARDAVVSETAAQAWVDAAYEPVAEAWRRELKRLMDRDRAAVVRANLPLQTHPELAERFDELFDGVEVVPASLAARHAALLRDDPLQAASLRVPLAWQHVARLTRAGRLRRVGPDRGFEEPSYLVAELPYDPVRGLDLRLRDDGA